MSYTYSKATGSMEVNVRVEKTDTDELEIVVTLDGSRLDDTTLTPIMVEALRAYFKSEMA